MGRDITQDDEGFAIAVNTFWGGTERGECVQITLPNNTEEDPFSRGYAQMTREEALHWFRTALRRLETQVMMDKQYPPWWQQIAGKTDDQIEGGQD